VASIAEFFYFYPGMRWILWKK